MITVLACLIVTPVAWLVGYQVADWLDRTIPSLREPLRRERATPSRSEPAVLRRTVDADGETTEIRSWR